MDVINQIVVLHGALSSILSPVILFITLVNIHVTQNNKHIETLMDEK